MPLLARRAASATERTLVNFRMNMYIRPPWVSVPALRIKAYRAAAGLGPTSEMGRLHEVRSSPGSGHAGTAAAGRFGANWRHHASEVDGELAASALLNYHGLLRLIS